MPGGVQHSGYYHKLLLFDHFVNHTIGESFRIAPSDIFGWMPAAVQKRIDLKRIEYRKDLFNEFVAETGTLRVILLRCFHYVVFRLRPCNDFPFHDFDRERSPRLISSRGTDELGSA
jgi:hypothetical protein